MSRCFLKAVFGIERALSVREYRAIWKYPKFDQAVHDDGDNDDYVGKMMYLLT
jgi:hypothetical protein